MKIKARCYGGITKRRAGKNVVYDEFPSPFPLSVFRDRRKNVYSKMRYIAELLFYFLHVRDPPIDAACFRIGGCE